MGADQATRSLCGTFFDFLKEAFLDCFILRVAGRYKSQSRGARMCKFCQLVRLPTKIQTNRLVVTTLAGIL